MPIRSYVWFGISLIRNSASEVDVIFNYVLYLYIVCYDSSEYRAVRDIEILPEATHFVLDIATELNSQDLSTLLLESLPPVLKEPQKHQVIWAFHFWAWTNFLSRLLVFVPEHPLVAWDKAYWAELPFLALAQG